MSSSPSSVKKLPSEVPTGKVGKGVAVAENMIDSGGEKFM